MSTHRKRAAPAPRKSRADPGSGTLGPGLRRARERSGVTLRGLARSVGVSPSLVSQIESGRVMPSVGTLYAMANKLGLLVDELFRNGDAEPAAHRVSAARGEGPAPAGGDGPVQGRGTRKVIRLASGVRWERLTAGPDDEVEFLYVVYNAGGESCAEDSLIRHGGKEYAYVISGRLGVRVGFEEYALRPGDSISFDARLPHRLWSIGKQPAVAIWVVLNRHGDARKPPRRLPRRRSADRGGGT